MQISIDMAVLPSSPCIHHEVPSDFSILCSTGENGMVDEAQKMLDEAEALKKVGVLF